ncbi:hypothetical protein AMTRI_Chr07g30800 [Amborella trichopoda]
MPQSYSGNNKN